MYTKLLTTEVGAHNAIVHLYVHYLGLELCTDVVVSAAARRSTLVGGGDAPPVQKIGGSALAAKNIFSKVPEKI